MRIRMQMEPEERIAHLKQNGPRPMGEVDPPRVRSGERDKIGKFRLGLSTNNTDGESWTQTPVLYLYGEHAMQRIVEVWAAENEELIEARGEKSVYACFVHNTSEGWAEAAFSVLSGDGLGVREPATHGEKIQESMGGTCPLCEGEYDGHLSSHLLNCPASG